MKRGIKKYIAVGIVACSLIVFLSVLVHAVWYAPTSEISIPPVTNSSATKKVTTSTIPVELIIPRLSIDTKVQTVGITTDNKIGVPTNFTDGGWYRYSVVPGKIGTAIIDGHVDNGLALAGVFKHLDELKKGDTIVVVQASGKRLTFVVTTSTTYLKDTPTNTIFIPTTHATLDLITCAGTWMQSLRTHDKRLVVSATLI